MGIGAGCAGAWSWELAGWACGAVTVVAFLALLLALGSLLMRSSLLSVVAAFYASLLVGCGGRVAWWALVATAGAAGTGEPRSVPCSKAGPALFIVGLVPQIAFNAAGFLLLAVLTTVHAQTAVRSPRVIVHARAGLWAAWAAGHVVLVGAMAVLGFVALASADGAWGLMSRAKAVETMVVINGAVDMVGMVMFPLVAWRLAALVRSVTSLAKRSPMSAPRTKIIVLGGGVGLMFAIRCVASLVTGMGITDAIPPATHLPWGDCGPTVPLLPWSLPLTVVYVVGLEIVIPTCLFAVVFVGRTRDSGLGAGAGAGAGVGAGAGGYGLGLAARSPMSPQARLLPDHALHWWRRETRRA